MLVVQVQCSVFYTGNVNVNVFKPRPSASTFTLSFGPLAVAVRRLERELADGVVEVLALDLGDLELERRRPARAVGAGEGARTPGGACVRGRK